jgi:hypothetical protein
MTYLKNKTTNEIIKQEGGYLQLSKNIRDQFIEANQEEVDFYLLQEARDVRLGELTTYHASDEVRILTINGVFKVTTDYESSRQYFSELVNKSINSVNAKNDIQRLAGKVETHTTDNVIIDWLLNGQTVQVPVTLLRIAQYQIGEIVDNNYLQFETHSVNIKNIADLENNPLVENEVIQDRINQINSYDFTAGYLKNQALNFTI